MKRIVWIDEMRGLGILLVVLVHSLGYTRNLFAEPDPLFWVLENWLHTFLMPFFVFVSGYSFASIYGDEGSSLKRIQKYLWRLCQIYLVFGTGVILAKRIFSSFTVDKVGSAEILQNLLLPDTTMWYIWFLLLMGLGAWVKRKWFTRFNSPWFYTAFLVCLLSLAVVYGGPLNLSGHPLSVQHLTSLPLFYVWGYSMARGKRLDTLKRLSLGMVTILLLCGILYFIYYAHFRGQFHDNLIFHSILRYANALVMTVLLSYGVSHIKLGKIPYLAKIGEQSLYIYLLHTYILAVTLVLLRRMNLSISAFLILLILYLIAMGFSLLGARIIRRVPVLDALFTGRLFS